MPRLLSEKRRILFSREELLRIVIATLCHERRIYELPAGIRSVTEYLDTIRKIFPIKSPLGIPTEQMNYNQLHDMDLDWTEDVANALIVWHHVPRWRKDKRKWLYQFLDSYISLKHWANKQQIEYSTRLIASAEIDAEDFYRKAEVFFNTGICSANEIAWEHLVFLSVPELFAEELKP